MVNWHRVGDTSDWLNFKQRKQRWGRATIFQRWEGNSGHLILNLQCWMSDPGSPVAALFSAWRTLVSWTIKCVIIQKNWCPHHYSENMISQSERFSWVRIYFFEKHPKLPRFYLYTFILPYSNVFPFHNCLQNLLFRRNEEEISVKTYLLLKSHVCPWSMKGPVNLRSVE